MTGGDAGGKNGSPVSETGKPPRPVGSLDRRRQLSTNREERDHKSRSAHSLKEKGSESSKEMRSRQKHMISRTGSFEVRHGGSGGSNSESGGPRSADFQRGSPGFWEPPPPPAFPYYWDGYHFWPSSCHASREELRGVEYSVNALAAQRRNNAGSGPLTPHDHQQNHHHHQQQQQRYGSNNTLNTSQQELSCGPYCGQRYGGPMGPMPPPHGYYGYHPHHSMGSLWNQVGMCGQCVNCVCVRN